MAYRWPVGRHRHTNNRFLDLGELGLAPGTVVHVEVRDPVGPDGIDWVRNPSTSNATTNSGFNGSRFVQTRQWTTDSSSVDPVGSRRPDHQWLPWPTSRSPGTRVYVETNHPTDRVIDVTWELDGNEIPNPDNLRNLDLNALGLATGTYQLSATASDPADRRHSRHE